MTSTMTIIKQIKDKITKIIIADNNDNDDIINNT